MKKVVCLFLFLSLFLAFYSNLDEVGSIIQILSFSSLLLSAIFSLLFGLVCKRKITLIELIFLLTGIISCIMSISNNDNLNSLYYSIIFLLAITSFSVISRVFSFYEFLNIIIYAYVFIVFYILIFYFKDYIFSIGGNTVYGQGVIRFKPMDLHPNLVGFLFSGGVIFLIIKSYLVNGFWKYFYIANAIICFSFVLAASARAGLMALVVSGLFSLLINLRLKNILKYFKRILFIAGLVFSIIIFYLDNLIDYIVDILELESDTRGVDSGGTGRVDLWKQGLDYISNNNFSNFLFGGGYRYSSADTIGFSTENSYITLMIDHGFLFSIIFFSYTIFILFYCAFCSKLRGGVYLFVFAILLYSLVQSIFNRYLLAIGNPLSIFLLYIYISFSVRLIGVDHRSKDKFKS